MCIGWQNSGALSGDKKNITILGGKQPFNSYLILLVTAVNSSPLD